FPDDGLDVAFARVLGNLGGLERLLADRVGVDAGDAEEIALDINREAAAERLRDESVRAGGQRYLVAGRDQHGVAVSRESHGLVVREIHVPTLSKPGRPRPRARS